MISAHFAEFGIWLNLEAKSTWSDRIYSSAQKRLKV